MRLVYKYRIGAAASRKQVGYMALPVDQGYGLPVIWKPLAYGMKRWAVFAHH